ASGITTAAGRVSRAVPQDGAESMDVDTFLASNQASWDRLSWLVGRAGRRVRRLSPDELEELVALYQRAATHLSYARSTYRDPALTATLSRLVARARSVVHGSPPATLRAPCRLL